MNHQKAQDHSCDCHRCCLCSRQLKISHVCDPHFSKFPLKTLLLLKCVDSSEWDSQARLFWRTRRSVWSVCHHQFWHIQLNVSRVRTLHSEGQKLHHHLPHGDYDYFQPSNCVVNTPLCNIAIKSFHGTVSTLGGQILKCPNLHWIEHLAFQSCSSGLHSPDAQNNNLLLI